MYMKPCDIRMSETAPPLSHKTSEHAKSNLPPISYMNLSGIAEVLVCLKPRRLSIPLVCFNDKDQDSAKKSS